MKRINKSMALAFASVMITGCSSSDISYNQEMCDKLLVDANFFAEEAYIADLRGDSESYEYFKNAFYNFSESYDKNCSEFR
jgi:hypothetical protein